MTRLAAIPLLAAAALAQEPALTIRTESRLVQMTVVVQDGKGNPVTGLTKDDFTVTDEGKPQTISVFEAHDRAEVQAARALPSGRYSNRLEYRGGAPSSATAILIDMVNTPQGYWGRAQPHLAKFLKQSDPRQRLAIYLLTRRGLRIIHDFTSVADELPRGMSPDMQTYMTSIGNAGGVNTAITGKGDGFDAVAYLIAWSEKVETAYAAPLDAMQTSEAMMWLARRLAGVPGRKNLVWVSGGFVRAEGVAAIGRASEAFDRAARALSDANVAVYPVDVRGLLALTDNLQTVEGRYVRFTGGPTPKSITMSELAARTGGRAFQGAEIDEAMPLVFQHARAYYTIGYQPSDSKLDGKFRQVRVRTRQAGVKATYRTGYYAAAAAELTEEQRKAELISAVWSPLDPTAIGIEAWLEGSKLAVAVDGRALLFDPAGDRVAARIDLLVVQRGKDGRQVTSTIDTFESRTTPDRAAEAARTGVTYRKELQLSAEATELRVVVRNRAGALGSVTVLR